MSDNSFLNASNIQKLNKELNDLKSRKVLTDLLNSQIDQNEHLSSENNTLIMNQRKLLNLLQSKDRVIEEIKSGTISFCEQGFVDNVGDQNTSTYRQVQMQSFQNKAQMMADHQWQIALSGIQQGVLRLRLLTDKHYLQHKHYFLDRLRDSLYSNEKDAAFRQIHTKNQQNYLLKLYSFFKLILCLQYKRKKCAFYTLASLYTRSIQEQHLAEEQERIVEQLKAEHNSKNSPMIMYKQFFDIFKQSKAQGQNRKGSNRYDCRNIRIDKAKALHKLAYTLQYNDSIQHIQQYKRYKTIIKKSHQGYFSYPKRFKAIIAQQKEIIADKNRNGNMSQEQMQEFIKKTQVIVNTIQNDFNMKCRDIEYLTNENTKLKTTHEQEINKLQSQLHDIQLQREQALFTLQNKSDLEAKYSEKCIEIQKLTEQFNNQKDKFDNEREEFENERLQFDNERDEYENEREQFGNERQQFGIERQQLRVENQELLEQIREYEEKFDQCQKVYDELKQLQNAFDEKCAQNSQLTQNIQNMQNIQEQQISNLNRQLQESATQGQEQHQSVFQQAKKHENNFIEKCKILDQLQQDKDQQQRQYEENIARQQREIRDLKMRDDDYQVQLTSYEQRQETLKKDILQSRQQMKEFQFEKEERIAEIESLTKKIAQLQNDKNNLVNNLEVSVINLKEFKQSYDQINFMLTKTKEEKHLLFNELEDKSNLINDLEQQLLLAEKRIKDADRKASASPNRQKERDDAIKQLSKLKKEHEELQANFTDLQSKLQRIKLTNSELTKEAIQLNQEKLSINETIDSLYQEIEQRDNHKQIIEEKIQILLQKLEEKDMQLQKQSIKPELLHKLTQDKIELEEENQGLKKELLRIHQQMESFEKIQKKTQQEIAEQKQKEQELKEEISQINQNLATLTRERIGYLRENQQKLHEVAKMKEENQSLKNLVDQYQVQIDEYQQQLDLFSKIFKSMEAKIKNIENKSQNTLHEAMSEMKQNQDINNSALAQLHPNSCSQISQQGSRSHSISTNQLENFDSSNINEQQLIKRIDQMKNMYQNSKSN